MFGVRAWLGTNRWEIAATLFPVATDGVHWVFFEEINRPLREALAEPSLGSAIAILALYLAYCVSIGVIGRLKPDVAMKVVTLEDKDSKGNRRKVRTTWPQLLFFYPSLGFGIVVVMAVLGSVGFAEEAPVLSEGAQQALVLGAVCLLITHMGLVAIDIEPRFSAAEPGYLARFVPTVLIAELAMNLGVALWIHNLAAPPAAEAHAPTAGEMLLATPLFFLFFAAPRFTFASKSFTLPSMASGVGFALYELWGLLHEAPLL